MKVRKNWLLVALWYILDRREASRHMSEDELAYKMLIWAWQIDKTARNGMTNQQFAKYELLRLGKGENLSRIASKEEVLALKPDLTLKQ